MSKTVLALLVCLVILTSFVLWFDHQYAVESGRYYNRDKGYSIKFPADWRRREAMMGTVVIAMAPLSRSTAKFCPNVSIVPEELTDKLSPTEYINNGLKMVRTITNDFRERERIKLTIDRREATGIVYTCRLGQLRLMYLQYFLVNGHRGYVITCTSEPDQFPKYRKQFEQIAQSFRFE